MLLTRLEVRDVRIVAHARVSPGPGINLLTGPNGSGKTSLLEAIHLLGAGRSFRVGAGDDLLRRGAASLMVRGDVARAAGEAVESVGIERSADGMRIRRAGEEVRSASALARSLPVVFVSPEAQRLLTDGAPLRRQMIDWLLFHVEPEYHGVHQRYRRLLRQRNAGLKAGQTDRALEAWERPMVEAAEALGAFRARTLEALLPRVAETVGRLVQYAVGVRYQAGWRSDEPLADQLARGREADRARGYTHAGPHRADLRFTVQERPAHRVLSRGEAKLFVVSIHLAQAVVLLDRQGVAPILLVDDLASELDDDARRRSFAALREMSLQAFVTGVPHGEPGPEEGTDRRFHVERGEVRQVV